MSISRRARWNAIFFGAALGLSAVLASAMVFIYTGSTLAVFGGSLGIGVAVGLVAGLGRILLSRRGS